MGDVVCCHGPMHSCFKVHVLHAGTHKLLRRVPQHWFEPRSVWSGTATHLAGWARQRDRLCRLSKCRYAARSVETILLACNTFDFLVTVLCGGSNPRTFEKQSVHPNTEVHACRRLNRSDPASSCMRDAPFPARCQVSDTAATQLIWALHSTGFRRCECSC